MSTPWIVAIVLQMVVTATLAVITLSLVRQFGILALRLNPSAGMDTPDGPGPGTELPAHEVPLLTGGAFQFGGAREHPLLTVFLSPDCSICTTVAHHVSRVARDYRDLDLLLVVTATPRVAREYVRDHDFEGLPVALKQSFPSSLGISTTPFALAVTADGTVSGRGVPNAMEHLEELIDRARDFDPVAAGVYADPSATVPSDLAVHHMEAAPAAERSMP
ncbi:MAG TPA: hypothetical protein VN238_00835 [Solirubrobacteraceae bacterium]|nr:hypothetical protein [Solirubrobacteraceae bacterium]